MSKIVRFVRKGVCCQLITLSALSIANQEGIAQPGADMAQSSPHRIGLQVGYQSYATSEPILSPFHYRGNYLLWQPSYTYRGQQHYHRFQLSRIEDELTYTASFDEFGRQSYVDLLGWQLQYTLLRKISKFNRWTLWVGGTLEATYFDKEIFHIYDFIDGRAAYV
ncbi:MAG: hypothetical protein WBA23_14600, partial [Tunicatimonas sp.]|uniref:hypothetical protein n=1 Tax=Tunicatimonas sp. TaxID=1940096 RepID=UPI003C7162D1